MNLKTYRAQSMADALAEVKRDFGKDAVIIHTRTIRLGAVLGVGGRTVVEITASDQPIGVARQRPRPAAPIELPARSVTPVRGAAEVSGRTPQFTPALSPSPTPEPTPEPTRQAAVAAVRGSSAGGLDATQQELAAIRRLVTQVLQTSRQTALHLARDTTTKPTAGAMPDPLMQHYLKLLEADVAAEIADELVARVREELPASDLARPAAVRSTIARHLAAMIPADPAPATLGSAVRDGRPHTIALVGPTGVGKTTTIAKLAANAKLRHNQRVGLITLDTYRIAAVEQLRTYAEIIGLPLKVASSPADVEAACHALRDCDLILIDTAGRSPTDTPRLEELRIMLAAAKPHQTHLVLSSAAGQDAMLSAAARFAPLNPTRVIFTKLDEAVHLGVIVNVARRADLKLSFVTNGQEVPDHLTPGKPEHLAELILTTSTPAHMQAARA